MTTRPLRRVWRAIADYLAAAPGTFVLFFVLVVTTLVLRGVDSITITRILREQSTNLVQMSRDAPRVLFLSAFLLDGGRLWLVFVYFNLVLVPVERWIGTYRWLGVVVAGHVGATIATTVGIWLQVRAGVGDRELAYPVDVGISYALHAAAGVVVYRLPRRLSALVAAGLLAMVAFGVVRNGTFTDWGHMTALLIGFALGPLVRHEHEVPTAQPTVAGGPIRRAWRWVAAPPVVVEPIRGRVAKVSGAVLLATAALAVVVMAVGDTDVVIPAARAALSARVVGRPTNCGADCESVSVRLTSGELASLRLRRGTGVTTGTRISVRRDTADSAVVQLAAESRRVDVRGLLGEIAFAAGGAGGVLLLIGRRSARAAAAATLLARL